MRSLIGCLILAASVGLIGSSVDANAIQNRPVNYYWSCYSGSETDSVYFTAVWEERVEPSEVYAAFRKFLADKYAYKGQVFCAMASIIPGVDLAKAKADQLNMRQHWQKQGKKVIETGWTTQTAANKSAAQSAPAAGAAPAVAGTYWSACQIQRLAPGGSVVNGPFNTYISDVFQHDLKTFDTLRKTYGEFISSKYGRDLDNPQCMSMNTEADIRAIYKTWIGEANKVGKAVMTGWKNEAK